MITWSGPQRLAYGVWISLGLGLVAGALETVWLATSTRLPLGFSQFLALGAVDVGAMGLVAVVLGALWGPVALLAWGRDRPSGGLSHHLAGVGTLLVGFYLWPMAWARLGEGLTTPAAILALMPLPFYGVVYFNARYWLRRVELEAAGRVPWNAAALAGAGAVVLIAAASFSARFTGGGGLEGDPSVLLITVDTLRRDHVGAYGVPGAPATPAMDRLAAEGVRFDDAVTPMPETTPAHASIFTGLHPLRHRVISNGHHLAPPYRTLAEVLGDEGWATGAFVSSVAVAEPTGLGQGFLTFDDGFLPWVPGANRIRVLSLGLRAWLVLGDPASTPWLYERPGQRTVEASARWLHTHADRPFFAWIHLFEPHAPYERHGALEGTGVDHRGRMSAGTEDWTPEEAAELREQYREEVAYTDSLVGQLLAALEEEGVADNTLVVLVADHGEMLGEHGMSFHHQGLYDPAVRIPLLMRLPQGREAGRVVDTQVSLVDLAPTVLDLLGLDALKKIDGSRLSGFITGEATHTMWTTLIGRSGRSFAQGGLVGMRTHELKYFRDLRTGEEQLYRWTSDPDELEDVSATWPEVVEQARGMIADEATTFAWLAEGQGGVDAAEERLLRLLGYQE
ncbi:MAG: sulfatase [Deltaproteobacteria bacterium]|nr:sulfatase [Deltaproteobacteria bacterium]